MENLTIFIQRTNAIYGFSTQQYAATIDGWENALQNFCIFHSFFSHFISIVTRYLVYIFHLHLSLCVQDPTPICFFFFPRN